MAKKTIKLKEFRGDVNSGMSDLELMEKYGLSPSQLDKALSKLQEKTQSPGPPVEEHVSPPQWAPIEECPHCGLQQQEPFDECPRCGIVRSKHQEVDIAGTVTTALVKLPSESSNLKVVALVVVLLIVGVAAVGYVAYRRIQYNSSIDLIKRGVDLILTRGDDKSWRLARTTFDTVLREFGPALASRNDTLNEKVREIQSLMQQMDELKGQGHASYRGSGTRPHVDLSRTGSAIMAYEQRLKAAGISEQEVESAFGAMQRHKEQSPRLDEETNQPDQEAAARLAAEYESAEQRLVELCREILQVIGR